MKHVVLLAAFLPAAALADPPSAPPPPAAGMEQPRPTAPHDCESFYPPGPFLNDIEGRTLVAFTVDPDGHVVNPVVKTSSGNADLDDAASRCVLRWTYRPAQKDGAPVAAPWMAYVVWKMRYEVKVVWNPSCSLPPQARTQPPGTRTVIAYVVTSEGAPSDISIRRSSGDAALDKAASDCIFSWHFEPRRTSDGTPVDTRVSTTVYWSPPD